MDVKQLLGHLGDTPVDARERFQLSRGISKHPQQAIDASCVSAVSNPRVYVCASRLSML